MEKCIGCELCAGVCPARCIYVRARTTRRTRPSSPGERYGFVYEIDYLRCIHCEMLEACPTEAITETKMFEFCVRGPRRRHLHKDEFLVDDEGRAPGAVGAAARQRGRPTADGCERRHPPATPNTKGKVRWSAGSRPASDLGLDKATRAEWPV